MIYSFVSVRGVAKGTTRQWRSFYQYEKKHSFRSVICLKIRSTNNLFQLKMFAVGLGMFP